MSAEAAAAGDDVRVRDATAEDDVAIRALVGSVMGWGDDGSAARMWRWKHVDNASGPSPTWVAVEPGGRLLAVRTFLRWRFRDGDGLRTAVRAVDTVTHPDARGRGLFKRLTLHGLDRLATQGVDFVFNTPNDQSRPGYLSMGWQPVRRLAVAVQPRGPVGALRMVRNRVPADLQSLAVDVGLPAADGLDDDVCAALRGDTGGLVTLRDPEHLRWRYAGLPELGYRVLTLGRDPAEGAAVLRARRRGTATELTLAEVTAPTVVGCGPVGAPWAGRDPSRLRAGPAGGRTWLRRWPPGPGAGTSPGGPRDQHTAAAARAVAAEHGGR